ncbi:hypothetical protein [Nocardia noduli]|uniref:hypothetical protein n=1 Tax=Nocardia noduli TaxID=2815722 RepID=UPI001C24D9E9|nr:hypothetical protein [Nocardia noduli]
MAEYKVGERLRSRVSGVHVLVIRVSDVDVEITCGGEPMAREGETLPEIDSPVSGSPVVMGKRYEDEAASVEVLCVSAGDGPLAVNGASLQLKNPKPLPASD